MEYVVFASKDLLKNLVSFQRMFRRELKKD